MTDVFTGWKGVTAAVRHVEEEQARMKSEDLSPREREFFFGDKDPKVYVTQEMVDDLGPKRTEQMEGWIGDGLVEVVDRPEEE